MSRKSKAKGPYGYGVNQWPPAVPVPPSSADTSLEAPPSIIAPILALIVFVVVLIVLVPAYLDVLAAAHR